MVSPAATATPTPAPVPFDTGNAAHKDGPLNTEINADCDSEIGRSYCEAQAARQNGCPSAEAAQTPAIFTVARLLTQPSCKSAHKAARGVPDFFRYLSRVGLL